MEDAFHIYTPLIDGTPLTTWFMAPLYAVCYALILLLIEIGKKQMSKKAQAEVKEKIKEEITV